MDGDKTGFNSSSAMVIMLIFDLCKIEAPYDRMGRLLLFMIVKINRLIGRKK